MIVDLRCGVFASGRVEKRKRVARARVGEKERENERSARSARSVCDQFINRNPSRTNSASNQKSVGVKIDIPTITPVGAPFDSPPNRQAVEKNEQY